MSNTPARPGRRPAPPTGPQARPPKPKCTVEVIDPDDILIIGINERWFRTFTTASDRYPIQIEIPSMFLNDGWNLVTAQYTNVALAGLRNDASVDYRILLDGQEVVHVAYKVDVQPQTFTINFKDSFSLAAREIDRGQSTARTSGRFQDMMQWTGDGEGQS